ncbi:hypothetical protein C8P68_106234 [Mucilaginibacter yixingensis]|uniref:Cell division protein FtsL n=1 Tax=Mucilaginibacter yixingensis TaxID=1295612 RepID=A0A2T5J7D5_9SPHI|nr:FtsL-like putative cell division protein [Mucilaginibacter yixingensis]PTQ95019.1 hypothetical protein C8P68_106234 [Mucilaginibacter yixingensis]
MTNRLRTEIQEEEAELAAEKAAEESVKVKAKKDVPENFLTQLFSKELVSTEKATSALPFVLFLAALGMVYIWNMHQAENNIRDIDKLGKEVKELSALYKSAKAELAYKSTLSQVSAQADSLIGLKEPVEPPHKITVKEGEQ